VVRGVSRAVAYEEEGTALLERVEMLERVVRFVSRAVAYEENRWGEGGRWGGGGGGAGGRRRNSFIRVS